MHGKNATDSPVNFDYAWAEMTQTRHHSRAVRIASVILQFSFRRFLNRGNRQNLSETRKPSHLGTYVPFSGNLWENEVRKPMELMET